MNEVLQVPKDSQWHRLSKELLRNILARTAYQTVRWTTEYKITLIVTRAPLKEMVELAARD